MKKIKVSFVVSTQFDHNLSDYKSAAKMVKEFFINPLSSSLFGTLSYDRVRKHYSQPENQAFIDMNESLSKTVSSNVEYTTLETNERHDKIRVDFTFDYIDNAPLSKNVIDFVRNFFKEPVESTETILTDVSRILGDKNITESARNSINLQKEVVRCFKAARDTLEISEVLFTNNNKFKM